MKIKGSNDESHRFFQSIKGECGVAHFKERHSHVHAPSVNFVASLHVTSWVFWRPWDETLTSLHWIYVLVSLKMSRFMIVRWNILLCATRKKWLSTRVLKYFSASFCFSVHVTSCTKTLSKCILAKSTAVERLCVLKPLTLTNDRFSKDRLFYLSYLS